MYNIFIRYPFPCAYKSVCCEQNGIYCSQLHNTISEAIGFTDFSLYCNGKKVSDGQYLLPHSTVHVSLSLPGGKGGFGSMLRAIGAQIEKTTNREACRDLSGRRLRDINEEQRLKNWISKKSEREAEKVRRRKERLERLKSRPKHNFVDFGYEKEISELPERIDDALTAGMEKIKKRPSEITEPSTSGQSKKKRLWLDEDISESSGSDSDSSSYKSNEECDEHKNNEEELSRNICNSESNEASENFSDIESQQKINTVQLDSNASQLELKDNTLKSDEDLNDDQNVKE